MAKAKTFSVKGVKGEDFSLPKEFGGKVNLSLLAQALHVFEATSHTGFSKVKTRAEINRTTKKLYKQKGTGGARHGSRRANLFVGGGVAHGPKLEKRLFSLPKGLKVASRNSVLSLKASRGEVILVSGLEKLTKTKEAGDLLKAITGEIPGMRKFTFVLADGNTKVKKFLANLKNSNVFFYKDANALNLFRGGLLIVDKSLFEKEKPKVKKAVKK